MCVAMGVHHLGRPPGVRCGLPAAARDAELGVPVEEIPRLRYPSEIDAERFEDDFAAQNRAVIIEGVIDDWPAFQDGPRCWRGRRWADSLGNNAFECNFDPVDNRMYRFEDGNPAVLLNPGRLRLPYSTFQLVGEVRQEILQLQDEARAAGDGSDLQSHAELQAKLNTLVEVQNVPLTLDPDLPHSFFTPFKIRLRELVPLAFYLANDSYALPEDLQADVRAQHSKLLPAWGDPAMSRCWVTAGGPWRAPHPPGSDALPVPCHDQQIYSCFHFDRMENLHSLLAGEKEVFLVAHRDAWALKGTRFASQKQWVVAPVPASRGRDFYLGPTLIPVSKTECVSDQSAVHPLRPARENRMASGGQWPDAVEAPVLRGRLRKGDTLYIPAHHWHFVRSTAPAGIGAFDDGPFAFSINFWWWPIHGKDDKKKWVLQNEVWSRANARIGDPQEMLAALGSPVDLLAAMNPVVADVEEFEKVD